MWKRVVAIVRAPIITILNEDSGTRGTASEHPRNIRPEPIQGKTENVEKGGTSTQKKQRCSGMAVAQQVADHAQARQKG